MGLRTLRPEDWQAQVTHFVDGHNNERHAEAVERSHLQTQLAKAQLKDIREKTNQTKTEAKQSPVMTDDHNSKMMGEGEDRVRSATMSVRHPKSTTHIPKHPTPSMHH